MAIICTCQLGTKNYNYYYIFIIFIIIIIFAIFSILNIFVSFFYFCDWLFAPLFITDNSSVEVEFQHVEIQKRFVQTCDQQIEENHK
jgi:hypothetical protein